MTERPTTPRSLDELEGLWTESHRPLTSSVALRAPRHRLQPAEAGSLRESLRNARIVRSPFGPGPPMPSPVKETTPNDPGRLRRIEESARLRAARIIIALSCWDRARDPAHLFASSSAAAASASELVPSRLSRGISASIRMRPTDFCHPSTSPKLPAPALPCSTKVAPPDCSVVHLGGSGGSRRRHVAAFRRPRSTIRFGPFVRCDQAGCSPVAPALRRERRTNL